MKFIGNTADIINWDDLYKTINSSSTNNWVDGLTYDDDLPENIADEYNREQQKNFHPLMKVGYGKMTHLKWRVFQPGVDFDSAVNDQLATYVGCKPFYTWISCTEPGCVIPPHNDLYRLDKMKGYYDNRDNVVRFHVHFPEPSFGHVFACEGKYFYDESKGNVYQWDDPKSIHGGCNFGLEKKYLYNFLGIKM